MEKTAKDIEIDIEKAKSTWKTVEFLATFGALFGLQFLFGAFLVSAIGAVIAYAIVNGILILDLKKLKEKLNNLKKQ